MKTNSHISFILLTLILSVFLSVNSRAQLNWVKDANNPVMEGIIGNWNQDLLTPVVIYEDNIFKMWYTGWLGLERQIGYAESQDGINWNMEDYPDPVIPGAAVGAWNHHKYPGTVLRINDTLKMWWSGANNSLGGDFSIGYAWAVEENIWNLLPYPVLEKGESGITWDDSDVAFPSVYYDGTIYHMYYTGSGGENLEIGYATSGNGINWEKNYLYSPVMQVGMFGTFYDEWIVSSGLVFYNETLRMFFTGFNGETYSPELSYFRVGYAWSDDYVTWNVETIWDPALDVGEPGSWDARMVRFPSVLFLNDTLKMWYYGYNFYSYSKIGYAVSSITVGLPDNSELTNGALKVSPSPFTNQAILSYQLKEKSMVRLDVYNINGELVSAVVNEVMEQGKNEVFFEGAYLQPGIYFCVLKTNPPAGGQTKKMIKL